MLVGNGFHEVRQQTDERMVEVFRGYAEAGFVLLFTEESALAAVGDRIARNTREVLARCEATGVLPRAAAIDLAEERVTRASRFRRTF